MHCFVVNYCLTFAPRCLLLVALQLHIYHCHVGGANFYLVDSHLLVLDVIIAALLVSRELVLFLVTDALNRDNEKL